jgi:CBS domain containing-hemolysin-like protein
VTTAFLLVALAIVSILVLLVSFAHLLCRESLRINARGPESLQYFKESLQDRLGIDSEFGALAFSLIRHFGLLALAVLTVGMTLGGPGPPWRSLVEGFLLASVLMLLTSYIVPRFLYRRTSGHWAIAAVPVLKLLAGSAKPVIAMLDLLESIADLSNSAEEPTEPTAEEHIEALIEAGKEEGILEETDSQLIQSVVAFGDKTVREVMTPRPNIVAIESSSTLEELRQLVINEQYSRVPVYEKSIDQLRGFVHVRDMFELDEEDRATRTVISMMRPLRVVPETKAVSKLLREMQKESVHMVGVVDEYGNVAGIATMEDLVEEIIGEVRDEHEPGEDAVEESEGCYVVAGNFDIDNLKELIDFTPEQEMEATTIGGLVTEWLGYVPNPGDSIERAGVQLEVLASDGRRVEKVRIRKVHVVPNGNS